MRTRGVWNIDPSTFVYIEVTDHARIRMTGTSMVDRTDAQAFINKGPTATKIVCDKLGQKLKHNKIPMLIDMFYGTTKLAMVIDDALYFFEYTKTWKTNSRHQRVTKLVVVTAIPLNELNKSEGNTIEAYRLLTAKHKDVSHIKSLIAKIRLKINQNKEYSKRKKELKAELGR